MNIICAGFGGQGVLTAGLILGKTATETGKHVTWIPSYGSEMRGGTANCSIKISETKIASPFIKEIDILIAMNQPSVDKFEGAVKPGGLIVVNSSMVKDHVFRKDVRVIQVDAAAIAEELSNPRGANLAMLGGLAAAGILMDAETIRDGLNRFFDEKGKNSPQNGRCFDLGMENARQG
ncbi:MAG: 2-oxoacid:acceptor oxidoreductase family protein [Treponema sp.]|jgi:2-oxoglutarate ferredoxin oxidoreductase subunit gamma|nr:2-oxoacid:acceptor oxidoreductase family protein [Treponema sp.]